MPILVIGNKIRGQRGVSLLELLVVLVVMAVLSAMVAMSVPPKKSAAERVAEDFALTVRQLADAAILSGRPTGIVIADQAWRGVQFVDGKWAEVPQSFGGTTIDVDVSYSLERLDGFNLPKEEGVVELTILRWEPQNDGGDEAAADKAPAIVPDLTFDPVGEGAPFVLTLRTGRDIWEVAADQFAQVEVRRAGEE